MGQWAETNGREDRQSNGRRKKNMRGSTVESNDSAEIPDSWETSGIPGLPLGIKLVHK